MKIQKDFEGIINMNEKTRITYYGQSLFVIESSKGIKIGIDPYNRLFIAKLPDIEADIVLVTHNHPDHSNISLFKGNPKVIKTIGNYSVKGISIEGLPSRHRFLRGKNIIFKIIVDNIVFCHLGDLGYIHEDDLLNKLKDTDILFIPIGGTFTIDYKKAHEIMGNINPSVSIPMHYRGKNSRIRFLDTIDNFLSLAKVYKLKDKTIILSKDDLPEKSEIWVLRSS